jgi:hypothetical protein
MLKASGLSDVFAREIVGARERRNLPAVHAPFHGRSSQRDAAVAGRDEHLKTDSNGLTALRIFVLAH